MGTANQFKGSGRLKDKSNLSLTVIDRGCLAYILSFIQKSTPCGYINTLLGSYSFFNLLSRS